MKLGVSRNFLADINPKITEVLKYLSYQNSKASVYILGNSDEYFISV